MKSVKNEVLRIRMAECALYLPIENYYNYITTKQVSKPELSLTLRSVLLIVTNKVAGLCREIH